ncbi:MAG TPA: MarR family transcriptional regulator [Microlunatus sp.]|uniref:Transcriptional regulator, MarR family n=2 Tax=Nakamurella TaxID=53460 RepID=C8XFH0_NAKMY|nr:MarR family transcriptional regulator [Nakamurella multipartita]ACV79947.1 transcriptional regulator, MarR family [Nakamurella multipartita DSM 44233]HET9647807.1 MarR family transcriptional regulator [Microlunatus sp.]
MKRAAAPAQAPRPGALTKHDFEALARFRSGIRRYLRFSEETVRAHGVTPQQYQLLLALKGFPDREWATVRELADRLQLRHHSVVELVNRAQARGLVDRGPHPDDARMVRIQLTEDGEQTLAHLSALHRDELRRLDASLAPPTWPDQRPDDPTVQTESIGQPQPAKADMLKSSLTALARHQLAIATSVSSGRSASTVFGGHENVLRQTMIALVAGNKLSEHENPGEATVHVLQGRVRLASAGEAWEGSPGDLLIVPDRRHDLVALEDAVVLLTVAKRK